MSANLTNPDRNNFPRLASEGRSINERQKAAVACQAAFGNLAGAGRLANLSAAQLNTWLDQAIKRGQPLKRAAADKIFGGLNWYW